MNSFPRSFLAAPSGLVSPLSLPGRWWGAIVAVGAGAAVLGICAIEFLMPSPTSFGALLLLPVLLSAWLLDTPFFVAIAVLALSSQFAALMAVGLDTGRWRR